MNLDELRSVQSKERQKDSLQQLRDSFYQDVAAYIADLRAERDRRAERVDNPFGDDTVRQLSDELDTAEEVAEALYERRVGKVVKLASFAAADMSASEEGMTTEEQALFDDLVDRIKQNKASVLDVLAGESEVAGVDSANSAADVDGANDAAPTSSTATDPTPPSPVADATETTTDDEPTTIGDANADHTPSPAADPAEQQPAEQSTDGDGMLADAMGAATERGGASDDTAAETPARHATNGATNSDESTTKATRNDAESTDAESGVPTTDGGSTTAAAPTSETQTEARSTATTPTQPSQSTSQPPDSNVSTTATPETASEPTESVTQSADSVAQSAESATGPAESATEPAESATGSATSATQSTASTVDDGHAVDRPTGNTGAETPSSTEGVSADTAASESIDRTTVRITEPVGTILGTDEREYTLDKEDVVVLPAANAEALLSKNAAVEIE